MVRCIDKNSEMWYNYYHIIIEEELI